VPLVRGSQGAATGPGDAQLSLTKEFACGC
jgi:hypothetical protein